MLEVNAVNTFYGKVRALWDVSLRVDEKEIVALVGANGAGKTTMLNTISGMIHPYFRLHAILRSENRSDAFLSNC